MVEIFDAFFIRLGIDARELHLIKHRKYLYCGMLVIMGLNILLLLMAFESFFI